MRHANVCSECLPGRTGRLRSLLALLGLDLAVLMACLITVVLGRYLIGGRFSPSLYLSLVWTPLLYAGIALLMRVYTHLQTPPEAIKKISGALSFFFLVTALFFFLTHEAASYSRSIFLVSWGLSLLAVPLARRIARIRYPAIFAWRAPCVVIGSAETVGPMVRRIEDNPHSGLRVIAVSVDSLDHEPFDVPVVPFADLPSLAAVNPHCYAVLLLDPCHQWPPTDAMERLSFHFRHVLLRSPQLDQISTWTRGVSISGLTLLTCHFKLLDPWRMRFKRAFDIVFCLTAGLAILPFMLLLAALIRLDSPGPAFFTQKRLGRGGRHFHIFKFRTMRSDAEAHLAKLLRDDPELARQWAENQKMVDDPRITRMGRWLRTTSIDELPQLINVLLGQMSLVGPRPIVDSEVARYGRDYGTYKHVRPGITGLWQISGRNRTDYDQRVTLDVAYVRNWSIYMDLWILARTVFEVVQQSGC